jgi:SulP family sulfate permease
MIFSYFAAEPALDRVSLMPLLVFMVGALLLFGSFLRVAELAQYISRTVIVAYVTGAAVLIMANQLAHVMGVPMMVLLEDGSSFQARTLPGIVIHLVKSIPQAHWQSLGVAAGTAMVYYAFRRFRPSWPSLALALIMASLGCLVLGTVGMEVPTYANARFGILDLLPPFPDFVSSRFFSDFSRLFGLALALAFLATIESSSMAKTLASVSGQRVDANQDMFSLGMANLSCAYLSGMPSSGSLTRSALNQQSGARTPFAALFNGLFCLIGALSLGPSAWGLKLLRAIPQAQLDLDDLID